MGKVHVFWEGQEILRNLHRRFDRYNIGKIKCGDFAKFVWPSQNIWTLTVRFRYIFVDYLENLNFTRMMKFSCHTLLSLWHRSNELCFTAARNLNSTIQFSSVFREDFVGVKENVLDRIGRDMCSDWRLCSVVADLTFSGAASTGSAIYYNKKSLHDGLLLFVCLLVTEATPFWITREARPIPYNIELCPEESS